MVPDFVPLLGQPAFEQARGVVMQLCSCDAERASGRMTEILGSTRGPPEDLVAALLTSSGRAELRHLLQPRADPPDSNGGRAGTARGPRG